MLSGVPVCRKWFFERPAFKIACNRRVVFSVGARWPEHFASPVLESVAMASTAVLQPKRPRSNQLLGVGPLDLDA